MISIMIRIINTCKIEPQRIYSLSILPLIIQLDGTPDHILQLVPSGIEFTYLVLSCINQHKMLP